MEVHVLLGNWLESDKDLFFGPLKGNEVFITPSSQRMANLLVELNIFSSNSQARKAGWNDDIPKGYSEWEIGKLRTKIFIVNIE